MEIKEIKTEHAVNINKEECNMILKDLTWLSIQ